jgi:hypothetical protein
MLQDEMFVVVEVPEVDVIVEKPPDIKIIPEVAPDVIVLATGAVGVPGPEGPEGDVGPAGPQGVQGPVGPTGPQGSTGTGILMKGEVATVAALPPTGNVQGDAYIVQADDSLHIWNGTAWISGGSIQGPPGPTGPTGAQGPTGATGATGAAGADSTVPGPVGPAGPTGPAGAPGYPTTTGHLGDILTVSADGAAPTWEDAPAGGGVDYIGDWAAPTTYKRGDVVRYLGRDYLAVNPSTGQVPGMAVGSVSVGLAFPASPVDGQRFTLVDSLTAPTYAWDFMYVAGITDAYKWVFVGGPTKESRVETDYPANPALTLSVPRPGYYNLEHGGMAYGLVLDTIYQASLSSDGGASSLAYTNFRTVGSMAGWMSSVVGAHANVLVASLLTQSCNAAGGTRLERRWIKAQPVRVS